jgi:chorismate synthase
MAGNSIGQLFRLTSFGESHGPAIGGIIDGCPAGLKIDMEFIENELGRRKAGRTPGSTSRKEPDKIEFLSGILDGMTTGTPLAFLIRNKDQRSTDYDHLKQAYRPSHADYTYEAKYGIRDHRGGGRASARETVVRVVAGAVAKLMLQQEGIEITGYVSRIGQVEVAKSYVNMNLSLSQKSPVRCPDPEASEAMVRHLDEVSKEGDTLGGTVTCIVSGIPAGLGEPVYDRLEAELAKAVLSINAVKGFDIGSGVDAAEARGSEHNDRFVIREGRVITETNRSGGVQGGISNGQDLYFRAFFKPVATLMQDQRSVNRAGEEVVIKGKGRHDVCVVPRAVPIVEAMAAITLADLMLRNRASRI